MTVIIPSWQTRAYLEQCLDALGDLRMIRVIVVDGNSDDGSADAAAARLPKDDVIRLPENRGFAAAVNTGIRHALQAGGNDPLVLLNTDTVASPAALAVLEDCLRDNAGIAAVAPQLLLADGTPQPFGFGDDPTPGYLLRRGWRALRRRGAMHDWGGTAMREVAWISFACVAIRREALVEVGELDEAYYMYFEDNDWCLRARRLGWRIMRQPSAGITHFGGAGLKQNPRAAAAYRNSLRLFYRKHFSVLSRLALAVMLPLYAQQKNRRA